MLLTTSWHIVDSHVFKMWPLDNSGAPKGFKVWWRFTKTVYQNFWTIIKDFL